MNHQENILFIMVYGPNMYIFALYVGIFLDNKDIIFAYDTKQMLTSQFDMKDHNDISFALRIYIHVRDLIVLLACLKKAMLKEF